MCSRSTSTQDVNLLQQTLLDLWLGDQGTIFWRRRRRLPVDLPGSPGASPRWLLGGFEGRGSRPRPSCASRGPYRSSSEVLELREPVRSLARRGREDVEGDAALGTAARRAALRRSGGRGRLGCGRSETARGRGDARSRRWRCSPARTRASQTSRRPSTTPLIPFQGLLAGSTRRRPPAAEAPRPRRALSIGVARRRCGSSRRRGRDARPSIPDKLGERELHPSIRSPRPARGLLLPSFLTTASPPAPLASPRSCENRFDPGGQRRSAAWGS